MRVTLALICLCLGCDRAPLVEVTVAGIPVDARLLTARFFLDARESPEASTFTAPANGFGSRTSFAAVLPREARGLFATIIEARTVAGAAPLVAARGEVLITGGESYAIEVALSGPAGVDLAGVDLTGVDLAGSVPDLSDVQPDLGPPVYPEVLHLVQAGRFGGTDDFTLGLGSQIDTTTLTLNDPQPTGVVFDKWAQTVAGAPEVAVLHVRDLTVMAGANVKLRGSRPLAIVASGRVEISGVLDASATFLLTGAGGFAPGTGPGKGGPGAHTGTEGDSGGGGAGHGTVAAVGGASTGGNSGSIAGTAGLEYGAPSAPMILQGGSGGGAGGKGDCATVTENGGAGGGGLQIFSAVSITIRAGGAIAVNGGGGGVGFATCPNNDGGGGGGGGSGGMLILHAPAINSAGALVAKGGGGGGGTVGENPTTTTASPAPGGMGSTEDAAGGNGAANSSAGAGTVSTTGQDAGGGGGAEGRITAYAKGLSFTNTGVTAPGVRVVGY